MVDPFNPIKPPEAACYGVLPAIATAAAAATATTAATTTTAIVARTGFVYIEATALQLGPVQTCNGCGRLFLAGHFDKRETASFAGILVCDDFRTRDLAEFGKGSTKIVFRRVKRQISYVDVHIYLPLVFAPSRTNIQRDTFSQD